MISQFTLLLALLPLAAAVCPDFLQGIDSAKLEKGPKYAEAMDFACGRRNYTAVFWSRLFLDQLTLMMVNETEDDGHEKLEPLFQSLQAKFGSLDSDDATDDQIDAKDFIDSTFERNKVLQNAGKPSAKEEEFHPAMAMAQIFKMMVLPLTQTFSAGISIVLMQTLKSGFGLSETSAELKQEYVETAMKAVDRVGMDDAKMGELFARLYVLVTKTIAIRRNSFDQFAEWTEKEWNSTEIGPLEILPAAEVLYIQYQNLKANESKIFVDWVLASHATADSDSWVDPELRNKTELSEKERDREQAAIFMPSAAGVESQEKVMDKLRIAREERKSEFAAICPSNNVRQCFNNLPAEARKEITATFPELFAHLNRMTDNRAFGRTNSPIEKNQLELEGSGEGSGMF